MCVYRLVIPAFFLSILFNAVSLRAEIELIVGVDRTTVYEGETIHYQIALSDRESVDESVAPDISAFGDFDVQALPKQVIAPQQSSVRVVINNKVVRDESSSGVSGVIFTYLLTPKKSGSLLIPAPNVVVAGKRLPVRSVKVGKEVLPEPRDGSIPITVRPPDEQDLVFMEISADRPRLYPCQPLTITLTVRVKELPENLNVSDRNPLSVLAEPPRLTIPWVDDAALPKGIVPRRDRDSWLSSLNVRRPQRGFSINDYATQGIGLGWDDDSTRSPFSMGGMFRSVLLQFSPKPTQVRHPDASGSETTYWEYRFSRTFLPGELGTFSFGPVTLRGAFAVPDPSSRQGASARQIYAVAPPVPVEVRDVPRENRPEAYIGAFGQFDWSVDLRPKKAKVGEPLTLTLRLNGQGSTANVKPPDLAAYPEIAQHFKTYPATEDVKDDSCTFTYTIRPLQAGSIDFPSIPAAFFDVEKEEFVTLRSEPISLEVTEAETIRNVPLLSGARRTPGGELQRSEKGLFANITSPDGAVDQSVDFRRWAEITVSFAVIYFILAWSVIAWKRWNADPKRRRGAGAASRARRRLSEVEKELQSSTPAADRLLELCNAIQGAIFGFVADRSDGMEQGMTTKDACRKLLEMGAGEKSVAEVRGILETLDAARYGGLDLRSLDDLHAATVSLLQRLSGELGKR